MFVTPGNLVGVVAAVVVMWLTGLVDDLRDISPPAKVAGMVLSGSMLTLVGLTIIYFRMPFLGFTVLLGILPNLSLFAMGLLYTSLTFGLVLLHQDSGIAWLAVHIVLVVMGLVFAKHNRWSILNKW